MAGGETVGGLNARRAEGEMGPSEVWGVMRVREERVILKGRVGRVREVDWGGGGGDKVGGKAPSVSRVEFSSFGFKSASAPRLLFLGPCRR